MNKKILLSGLTVMMVVSMASAAVKLPPVISSHMVMQRDMVVPIWGTAASGEAVAVKFRDQIKTVTADAEGKWMVKLDPLKAGGPDTLTVNDIVLEDVLVGEVWVGSGQSNMQTPAGAYIKGDSVLAANIVAAPYPKIRLVSAGKSWTEADGKSLSYFSALLFSFGLPLQKELDVPVGLMVGAKGGTPSGYWLSKEAFDTDPACKAAIHSSSFEQAQKEYTERLAKWEKQEAEAKVNGKKNRIRKPMAPRKPGVCDGEIGHLYEKYICPFQPYGIRGVLWDQGESGTAISGIDQYTLMGALIRGWRKEWAQGDFPFIYVQKPSGGGCAWNQEDPVTRLAEPFESLPTMVPADGDYVENHIRIMDYPNTAMVISSDLGGGIHPANKSAYGRRAATVALATVYGRKIECYGPMYASHAVEEGKIRIKFSHVGQGLALSHGDKLQGFAIAGEDRKFEWADAVIDGDTVVLSSTAVPKPVAVRYAWSLTRPWANLFNKDGLPAVPFRTDKW
jgi:sialate O-acetylesterase